MKQVVEVELERTPLPAIDHPVVMFVISKTYGKGASQESLYDAARGNWRIGAGSRFKAKIALGVADGLVRTAFEINGWGGADEAGSTGRRRRRPKITVRTLTTPRPKLKPASSRKWEFHRRTSPLGMPIPGTSMPPPRRRSSSWA